MYAGPATFTALSVAVQAVMVASSLPVWPTMSPLGKLTRTCAANDAPQKRTASDTP